MRIFYQKWFQEKRKRKKFWYRNIAVSFFSPSSYYLNHFGKSKGRFMGFSQTRMPDSFGIPPCLQLFWCPFIKVSCCLWTHLFVSIPSFLKLSFTSLDRSFNFFQERCSPIWLPQLAGTALHYCLVFFVYMQIFLTAIAILPVFPLIWSINFTESALMS